MGKSANASTLIQNAILENAKNIVKLSVLLATETVTTSTTSVAATGMAATAVDLRKSTIIAPHAGAIMILTRNTMVESEEKYVGKVNTTICVSSTSELVLFSL